MQQLKVSRSEKPKVSALQFQKVNGLWKAGGYGWKFNWNNSMHSQNSTQLSNHIEQQLHWGAPGSWHWNGSVPGMAWEEPVPLLAILNTAVQSIDLQGNRSGTGSATPKG